MKCDGKRFCEDLGRYLGKSSGTGLIMLHLPDRRHVLMLRLNAEDVGEVVAFCPFCGGRAEWLTDGELQDKAEELADLVAHSAAFHEGEAWRVDRQWIEQRQPQHHEQIIRLLNEGVDLSCVNTLIADGSLRQWGLTFRFMKGQSERGAITITAASMPASDDPRHPDGWVQVDKHGAPLGYEEVEE